MLVPIYPPLDGRTAERFPLFARTLSSAQTRGDRESITAILQSEIDWLGQARELGDQALIYEACVRVLADLARLRWRIVEEGYGFFLENPKETRGGRPTEELIASKVALREELRPVVDEQQSHPAVKDFLRRMTSGTRDKKSISVVTADAEELRERLQPALALQGEARVEALRTAVRPYLQRATDEIDPYTGHPLRDLWRYFRFGWSIPQTPVPGRQLLYLVRDAAHPAHAVMGIASLNNCPLEMGEVRETFIGWHRRAVTERILAARDGGAAALEAEFAWLMERIEVSMGEVEWTNLVSAEEVTNPTEEAIARLLRRGQDFARQREQLLKEIVAGERDAFDANAWELEDAPPVEDEVLQLEAKASIDKRMHAARKQLVAKKRAYALGRLFQAKRTLTLRRADMTDPERVLAALESDEVKSALNIVLEALKARRAGANMLEITTCGAVAPYGPLLGGKLVALMMLSPQVGADYRAAYEAPSIISSQMRNQPVIRDNALVYLGTTSLYVHGSSQYNRLKLPAGILAEDQEILRYQPIGETTGFGTVQFSPETSRALDALLSVHREYKDVNSVFGEGTSPKLRKLKAGMRLIGFDPDRFLRHQQRRLIYAAPLTRSSRDWLLERTTALPDYLANPKAHVDASDRIADFWRTRWLANRLDGQYGSNGVMPPKVAEVVGEDKRALV
jgi:hypothetical protein